MFSFFLKTTKRLGYRYRLAVGLFFFSILIVLNPISTYIWDIVVIFLLFLIPFKKYNNFLVIMFLVWGFAYAFIAYINGAIGPSAFIHTSLMPFLFCKLGFWCIDKYKSDESLLMILLLLSNVLISIAAWTECLTDILTVGFGTTARTFSADDTYSATLYGLISSVCLVGLPIYFITKNKISTVSMWCLIPALLSILMTIHLINRTAIVILMICFFIVLLYKYRGNIIKPLMILSVVMGVILLLIYLGVIPDTIVLGYETRFNEENVGTAGNRSFRWVDAISRLFYMPLGWYGKEYLTGYYQVHNFWLDIGRVAGIIPFLLLLIPTISSIKIAMQLFYIRNKIFIAFLLGLYVSIFAAIFMEPAMEGLPIIVYYFIFVCGIMNGYYRRIKKKKAISDSKQ